jgi:hypothetical protein
MLDISLILVTVAFFAVAGAYVTGCRRLAREEASRVD